MNRVQRVLVASIIVAVASIAIAAVRLTTSGGEASTAPQTPRPASSSGGAEVEPDGEPAVVAPAGDVRTARVRLEQGVPKPRSARIRARVGDEIRITVSSAGTEDEVVVNGYGKRARVSPEQPARLRFVATRDGSYDVVLDTSGVKVADLDVSS